MILESAEIYQSVLHLIERGQYEDASLSLSELRNRINIDTKNIDLELMRKLLTLRLSIRNGFEADFCLTLNPDSTMDTSLKGEIHFVKGLYYSSQKNFKESLNSFIQSEHYYKLCHWNEKRLMSWYNRICCEINIHGQNMTESDFENLLLLQKEAEIQQSKRLLGLIHRQKSYFFKDQNKWRAALFEAESALPYLELHASKSDYQIALLNVSDCFIELNDFEKSMTALERVVGYMDRRVAFVFDYIQYRLGRSDSYPTVTANSDPHFLSRWENFQNKNDKKKQIYHENTINFTEGIEHAPLYTWNSQLRILNTKTQDWTLSQFGKETTLIETLINQPQSAMLLAEKIWPEFTDTHTLKLRFYQLISRLKKRFPNLIINLNGKYSLQCKKIYSV